MTLSPIPVEHIARDPGFTHLSRLAGVHGLEIDLRYAGTNNFAARNLYGAWDCAWLRTEAAQGLLRAAAWLAERRPGWRLRVLDALRPQRVQEAIWRDVEGTAMQHYFAHPVRGSIHSFGMAVDLTLLTPEGTEADMGSGFDEMHERSHPALHAEHLALGVLTAEHLTARGWLAAAMRHGGFDGIATEWWHFDHGDRDAVRASLPRVW